MMRPNVFGWALLLFFFAGGVFFWRAMPEIWIGQGWMAVSVLLAVAYLVVGRRADRATSLIRSGVRGRAQILEMTQTGMYVNEQPRVKLRLRIEAPGITPFEDEKTITVPLIALGQLSGGSLDVYLNPADPRKYVVDWSGGGAAPAGAPMQWQTATSGPVGVSDPAAQQAVMDALKQHGVDPTTGTVDLRQLPAAREAVLRALREHGVDAAHATAASDPSVPITAGEPIERLTKLEQLRTANLITNEEYDRHRKQILDEV